MNWSADGSEERTVEERAEGEGDFRLRQVVTVPVVGAREVVSFEGRERAWWSDKCREEVDDFR